MSQLTESNAVEEFETYESKEFGFTIEHPSDWQPKEPGSFEIELVGHRPYITRMELPSNLEDDISTRTNHPTVEIDVEEPNSDSLDQYVSEQIDELVTFTPDTNVETNKTTLVGLPAYTLVMTSHGGGGKGMHIYTMTDQGRVYDIHYAVHEDKFDTYLPIVQRMVDSFMIHASPPKPSNLSDVEGLETERGDEASVLVPVEEMATTPTEETATATTVKEDNELEMELDLIQLPPELSSSTRIIIFTDRTIFQSHKLHN